MIWAYYDITSRYTSFHCLGNQRTRRIIFHAICKPYSSLFWPVRLSQPFLHWYGARNHLLLILQDHCQAHSSAMRLTSPLRSSGSSIWSYRSVSRVRCTFEWLESLTNDLGDIIHMSAMGSHIVVLHKMEDIAELLERRSAIYSSRPWIPSVGM